MDSIRGVLVWRRLGYKLFDNLFSGTIDEIDKQVNMTWVQPRVLEYTQVRAWARLPTLLIVIE